MAHQIQKNGSGAAGRREPECASRTPVSGPQPSGGSLFGLWAGPNPKKPVFDFRAHFCHSAPVETHASGFRLRTNARRAKSERAIFNAPRAVVLT